MLVNTKAKIGVFSIALGAYLPQFPQLVPNFEAQYEDFKKTIPNTVEIIDGGMVTTKEQAMAAGDKFRAADVDLVFLQLLTYATSYNVLPAIRDLDVPVVCINVQKKLAPDYANTDIPIWLGDLYACGAVGEAVADLERAGKRPAVITGGVEGGVRAKLGTKTLSQTVQQAGGAQYKAVLQAGRGALAQNGCRSLCGKVDLRQLSGVLYQCTQRKLRPGQDHPAHKLLLFVDSHHGNGGIGRDHHQRPGTL